MSGPTLWGRVPNDHVSGADPARGLPANIASTTFVMDRQGRISARWICGGRPTGGKAHEQAAQRDAEPKASLYLLFGPVFPWVVPWLPGNKVAPEGIAG